MVRLTSFARTSAAAALLLLTALPLAAQNRDDDRDRDRSRDEDRFTWSGQLGERRTIILRNINGDVQIEQGTGRTVEVVAVKRWRRGDPADVRIEARATPSGDVVICAIWHERADCDERGYSGQTRNRRGWDNNDVSVHFTVKIPADARLDAATVNGELMISGTTGDIRARTTNGTVEAISNGGRVMAETVNGSIRVRTTAANAEGLEYETVNGSIIIELPQGTNIDVDLSTVNGGVSSDFPMTLDGTINPRRIRASIGNGGPLLRARTVNGSIRLERR
jgi:hypothetical protein